MAKKKIKIKSNYDLTRKDMGLMSIMHKLGIYVYPVPVGYSKKRPLVTLAHSFRGRPYRAFEHEPFSQFELTHRTVLYYRYLYKKFYGTDYGNV